MTIYDGRESFYQWDLNQKITSDAFKVGDIIHFSNMIHPLALTVKAYELDGRVVADVPNILLQTTYSIKAFRYISNPTSAQTVEERTFIVNQKAQPSDYFYTETELYVLRHDVEETLEATHNALDRLEPALDDAHEALNTANEVIENGRNLANSVVVAERSRVDAENLRAYNEEIRIANETSRVNAEKTRNNNELARNDAEQLRIYNENIRQNSEDNRVFNENDRQLNETTRVKNEETRVGSENDRVFMDEIRETNEITRQSNEDSRVNAETKRQENEQSRVSAEVARIDAENERIANEEVRKANFESLPNNIGNALKGIASGEVVRVDDVSSIEHTAKVKVNGKNLIAVSNAEFTQYKYYEFSNPLPTGTYTVSTLVESDDTDDDKSLMNFALANGDKVIFGVERGKKISKTFIASSEIIGLHLYAAVTYNTSSNDVVSWNDFQLEQGNTATEYEPYIDPTTVTLTRYGVDETDNPQTYTPNVDGTLEIPSLSPTMTLFTDTEGVTIDLEYNKDTNKAFDELLSRMTEIEELLKRYNTEVTE